MGFTNTDREIGMKWAATTVNESEWTPRQKWYAWDVLRKYRSQLKVMGIDFTAIPVPPRPTAAPAKTTPAVTQAVTAAVQQSLVAANRVEMIKNGVYRVFFPYELAIATEDIKRLPPRLREWHAPTMNDNRRYWTVRFELANVDGQAVADFNNFLAKHRFPVPEQVQADIQFLLAVAVKQKHEREEAYKQSFATDADLTIPGLNGTLRGFQKAGVLYAKEKRAVIIADEMGLGKTVQAIATIQLERAFPALIVCKAALRGNWINELRKWLPDVKCTRDPADMEYRLMQVLVISYEGLVKWYDKLEEIDWKAVVVDESQMIKSSKAQRTKACKDIARVSKADLRICLTGTPFEICPYDIFSQITFLGKWKELGGNEHCFQRFCGNDRRGAQNLAEFNALLRRTCYVRREKKMVLTELPPKQRVYVDLEIDNAKEYKDAASDIIGWLKNQVARNPEAFDADPEDITRDQSVSAKQAYVASKAAAAEGLVRIAKLRELALKGMLEPAKAWIEDFVESGEKLIVFANSIEAQRQVHGMFKDIAVWTRSGSHEPQWAVDQFQTNPKIKIIVCSLKADNAGHTLTAASNVCHLEPWWTPTIHDQCDDRAHRIGQRDSVTGWYLRAVGTLYEDIYQLLEERRRIVELATNGSTEAAASAKKSILNQLVKKLAA